MPCRANNVSSKSSIDVPVVDVSSVSLRSFWRRESSLTLGVHDRLVARIFGDEELLYERDHLCARFHVVVAPAPGGNCALTGLRNQLGGIL